MYSESIQLKSISINFFASLLILITATASNAEKKDPEATTPELVLEGTPTPKPKIKCEYSDVDASVLYGDWAGEYLYKSTGNPHVPKCIENTMLKAYHECVATYPWNYWSWQGLTGDDCVYWKVFGGVYDYAYRAWMQSTYGNPYSWSDYAIKNTLVHDNFFCYWYGHCVWLAPAYGDLSGLLYIRQDEKGDCTAVNKPDDKEEVCHAGTLNWWGSPISLLWEDSVDVDQDLAFSQFPIDLQKAQEPLWYIWKASSKAPLLVYDPKHTGEIKSATQLFGDWTFGGKSVASLQQSKPHSVTDVSSQSTIWENGYEALATLDSNHDGQISGQELEPLALWFDNNRDGISDAGEVKRLDEVDVVTLFYTTNGEVTSTGSLFANKGYQRKINGKLNVGRSVDWRSDGATTKQELINKHLAAGLGCADKTKNSLLNGLGSFNSSTATPTSSTRPLNNTQQTDLSGFWQWRSTKELAKNFNPEGFFSFSADANSIVKGHSYTSFGVSQGNLEFNKIFSALPLLGKLDKSKNGKINFKFKIKPDDTNILESTATYDEKQQIIRGTTVAKVSYGTKAVDLSYTWEAKRMPLPKR